MTGTEFGGNLIWLEFNLVDGKKYIKLEGILFDGGSIDRVILTCNEQIEPGYPQHGTIFISEKPID